MAGNSSQTATALPGECVPYVLEAGGGRAHLLLGEVGRALASTEETGGAISVMTLTGPAAPRPIPQHFHELEHDVFLCVRGRFQVWAGAESRILTPGDLASVPAGVRHAYQALDHCSMFVGPIVPAGWDRFFDLCGTPYDGPAYPPVDDSPPPFEKFGEAEGRFRMTYVHDKPYAEASVGAADDELPGSETPYFLRAGQGPRHAAFGQVAFQLMRAQETGGRMGMAVVEGPSGSAVPEHSHAQTMEAIYCLGGLMTVTLNGEEHLLAQGDYANIPPGVRHAIRFERDLTRYATMNAPAGIERFHELAGSLAEQRIFAARAQPPDPAGLAAAAAELDVVAGEG
ncbi:MAG TPA: quercetin 2,3-dioxygenase [Solirubrobacteraceae bacterium]|jgi:quercetin dioxygenase-like cupin family protein|nr:quercetin 2,3-dioxygenase [Solirubrobacteraceae bacterium]